jgi:hypothetical protein
LPNYLAGFSGGHVRHGTRVKNVQIGCFAGSDQAMSALDKTPPHFFDFADIKPAAYRVNSYSHLSPF